jgi:hypothetical protein
MTSKVGEKNKMSEEINKNATRTNKKETQFVTNSEVEAYLASDKSQVQVFEGKTLEWKYWATNKEELQNILDNKEANRKRFEEIRKDLKIKKIICRFYFRGYVPSREEQRQIIDFQKGIFDEITVQLVGNDFVSFKNLLAYSVNELKQPTSSLIDVKHKRETILDLLSSFSLSISE